MKKILNFSMSIILALSLTSGNITASAHVEENKGYGCLQPAQQEKGSHQGNGQKAEEYHYGEKDKQDPSQDDKKNLEHDNRGEDSGNVQTPCDEKEPEGTSEVIVEQTKEPEGTPEVIEEQTEEPEGTPEVIEERTEEPEGTPEVIEEQTEEPEGTPEVIEEQTEEPEETPKIIVVPTEEPKMTVSPATTTAIFYVLKQEYSQPDEIRSYPVNHYVKVGEGLVVTEHVANDNQAVAEKLVVTPAYDPSNFGFGLDWYIQWYVIKTEVDGWHVDGIWTQATAVPTETPVATEEATEDSDVETLATPEVEGTATPKAEPVETQVPVMTGTPAPTAEVVATVKPQVTKPAEVNSNKVPTAVITNTPATQVSVATTTVAQATKAPSAESNVVKATKVPVVDTTVTQATEAPVVNATVVPEREETNTDDVTVITPSASAQVTEAPATTSHPVNKDEKNNEAFAKPDVINTEKDNSFATDSETVVENTKESDKTDDSLVVTTPEIPGGSVVENNSTVENMVVTKDTKSTIETVDFQEDDVANSAVSTSTEKINVSKKQTTSEKNIDENSVPSSAILPQTGVVGEYVFYVFGTFLCALGIGIFSIFARRKQVK